MTKKQRRAPTPPPPREPSPPAKPNLWSFALPYTEDTMRQLRAFGGDPRASRQKVINVATRWVRWFCRDEHQLHYAYDLKVPPISRDNVRDLISRCDYTFQWTVPQDWSVNEKLFVAQNIQTYTSPGYLVWLALLIETAGPDIVLYRKQAELRSARAAVPVEDALRAPRIVAPGLYDIRPVRRTGRFSMTESHESAKPQSVPSSPQPDELVISEDGDGVHELQTDVGPGVSDGENER